MVAWWYGAGGGRGRCESGRVGGRVRWNVIVEIVGGKMGEGWRWQVCALKGLWLWSGKCESKVENCFQHMCDVCQVRVIVVGNSGWRLLGDNVVKSGEGFVVRWQL